MKEIFKIIIALAIAICLTALPGTCFYFLWDFLMEAVPITSEWATLIKAGLTLVMVVLLAPLTIFLSIMFFAIGASIASFILE